MYSKNRGLNSMSVVTKAKINLKEGTIELEGSEAFVSKYLDAFKKDIQSSGLTATTSTQVAVTAPAGEAKQKRRRGAGPVQRISPIPLNLKAKGNEKPALKDLFKSKNPKTNMEKITVFAYYLDKYLGIGEMQAGHAVSCYNEVGARIPSIPDTFRNAERLKGYVEVKENPIRCSITTTGINLVEHDLPRKENATADKTAT